MHGVVQQDYGLCALKVPALAVGFDLVSPGTPVSNRIDLFGSSFGVALRLWNMDSVQGSGFWSGLGDLHKTS